jgi:hypothetical protein
MNTGLRFCVSATLIAFASGASAHVRLMDPPNRYAPPNPPTNEDHAHLKEAPCGVTGDSRTTDVSRITTYAPGETITVTWIESIDHEPAYYRIALDMDGQDNLLDPTGYDDPDTAAPILLNHIEDPPGSGGEESITVTLPNETCDTCTLQLIQVMGDKLEVWGDDDVYHQCADIVIAGTPVGGGGTGGSGVGGSTGGSGVGGSGGSVGVDPVTGGTTSTGGSSSTSGGATTTTNSKSNSGDEGGCGFVSRRDAGSSSSALMLSLAALGLVGLRRRR